MLRTGDKSIEKFWLESRDAKKMLEYVPTIAKKKPHLTTDRKMRLFTVACSRTVDSTPDFYRAINQLELSADLDPYASSSLIDRFFHPDWDISTLVGWAAKGVEEAPNFLRDIVGNPFQSQPRWCDVGGGGYTPAFSFYLSEHCTPLHQQIKDMVKRIYDEKDFSAMTILADLIEDTGYINPLGSDQDQWHVRIVEHLRAPVTHVRGCWALDLLRGQE